MKIEFLPKSRTDLGSHLSHHIVKFTQMCPQETDKKQTNRGLSNASLSQIHICGHPENLDILYVNFGYKMNHELFTILPHSYGSQYNLWLLFIFHKLN